MNPAVVPVGRLSGKHGRAPAIVVHSPGPSSRDDPTSQERGNKKHTKKRKKRTRGEKPRIRVVLRDDKLPADVSLSRGRKRELDRAPSTNDEAAVPRKLRALFAAKAALEAKAVARTAPRRPNAGAKQVQQAPECKKKLSAGGGSGSVQKRQTTREIVVAAVRKHSHQSEKKRAYYAKRAERMAAKKERRKRKKMGCEDSDLEWDDAALNRDQSQNLHPRFGEQAMQPPKLEPVKKRRRL